MAEDECGPSVEIGLRELYDVLVEVRGDVRDLNMHHANTTEKLT